MPSIRCACGNNVRKHVNRNGLVLCPNCRNAFLPRQFDRPAPPRQMAADMTKATIGETRNGWTRES